ncbi:hypothetical protein [Nocardia vaccinii]|uniref:hypothetical protein n=1 Tax=Nocardia vaccinii TaxID=1822 RepID=UPI00082FD32E|nr:hypothetical protein [Nocardia vaccinii]
MTFSLDPAADDSPVLYGELGGLDVAVVAVSGRHSPSDRTGRSHWAAMEDYTLLLCERSALRPLPVPLLVPHPRAVCAHIAGLPGTVCAVFLIGLSPIETAAVQAIMAAAEGPLIISETDTLTAAIGAATMTTLRGRGLLPGQGRLAVLCAEHAPRLQPVLLDCGAATVTTYQAADLPGPLLRRLLVDHDVVIDLDGLKPAWTMAAHTVAAPADPYDYAALPLPGLLAALCGHGSITVTATALAAAARALALITPVDRTLPSLADRRLTTAVARHVSRVLASRTGESPSAYP